MANLINLEQVSKSFGIKPLLDSVSLGVEEGERIGVVGLNGGGKTTMLEVLAGLEEPDSGRVSRVGGLRMAVVTQRGVLPEGSTVGDVVLGPLGVAEHEWAGDARIRSVLAGIGVDKLGLDASSTDCPVAKGDVSRWRPHSCRNSTCSCSTSPPTTSTSRACSGWPSTCSRVAARSSS